MEKVVDRFILGEQQQLNRDLLGAAGHSLIMVLHTQGALCCKIPHRVHCAVGFHTGCTTVLQDDRTEFCGKAAQILVAQCGKDSSGTDPVQWSSGKDSSSTAVQIQVEQIQVH